MPPKTHDDPHLERNVLRRLSLLLDEAAEAYADVLQDDLSETEGGQGRWYSGLPNRSSAPGQHPRQQFGDLMSGVFNEGTREPTMKRVGIAGDNSQGKLNRLVFDPESIGGRKVGWRTFQSSRTRSEVYARMQKLADSLG